MVGFPPCKINIGLQVLARRPDGFHNLNTVFYPLPLHDVLELLHATETRLYLSGIPVKGGQEDNLCLKAYRLVKEDFPDLPPLAIYLHKAIPMGAGLGGGSADAAYMLRMINEKCNLNLKKEQLFHYAAQLGSDCSFFIQDQPCLAEGRGELLHPLNFDVLQKHHLLLVCPDILINTAQAYKLIHPRQAATPLDSIIRRPVTSWKALIVNDFEESVFKQHPYLKEIKEALYEKGAAYASLSGSGSALYGLFPRPVDPAGFSFKDTAVYAL